ncbi:PaaI family thioesterase [Rhizobium sp. C4]|uniref:PaaI family thioesterase n=1 Tax=Rhizobium sp. C4 TaxID=1349800 RepID=UPI001E4B3234|nr:PaaI family thioesterase [Rhizobium sp. C4]MCD2171939.1 PaaI family thioesterase [Rhizobium sp. C4]
MTEPERAFAPMLMAEVAKLSGLETLQKILSGEFPAAPIARVLNFRLSAVEEGQIEFRGVPTADHLNPMGAVHGGWTATILDSALGCVVMSMLKPGEGYTTAEFKVNIVRPLTAGMGEVACEARILHRGRTLATAEGYLRDGNGRLLAHGTETCAIFPIANLMR